MPPSDHHHPNRRRPPSTGRPRVCLDKEATILDQPQRLVDREAFYPVMIETLVEYLPIWNSSGSSSLTRNWLNCRSISGTYHDELALVHVHPTGELVLARAFRRDLNCDRPSLRQIGALAKLWKHDLLAARRRFSAREAQPQRLSGFCYLPFVIIIGSGEVKRPKELPKYLAFA
jgi:hypothetical protein